MLRVSRCRETDQNEERDDGRSVHVRLPEKVDPTSPKATPDRRNSTPGSAYRQNVPEAEARDLVLIAVGPAVFLQPLVAHDERRAPVPPGGQPIEDGGERPDERNSPAGRAGDQGIERVNADCHCCVAGEVSKWRATVCSVPFLVGEKQDRLIFFEKPR